MSRTFLLAKQLAATAPSGRQCRESGTEGSPAGVRHRSGGQARRLPIVFKAAIEVTASQSQDGVAARTVQNMPDCLQREPITVLQPASMTPEPTNRCWLRNSGYRMRSAFLSKYSASVRILLANSGSSV